MPTPLHIQNTARVQHYGFLRGKERREKKTEEEDLGVFSSEDEDEVEEKNEGVMEVTAASVGAMKVAVLDEQECVLTTEVDTVDASVRMETFQVRGECASDAKTTGAVSFLIQCFYLNTKLNRFEPCVEPTSILASLQMSEE